VVDFEFPTSTNSATRAGENMKRSA